MGLGEQSQSVRARVLAAMLGLTAVGMVAAGVEVYVVQYGRIDERVDVSLTQEVTEIRTVVESGNPATGRAWASLDEALLAGVERQVPDENQEVVALVDGQVAFRPRESAPPDVGALPDLMGRAAAVSAPEFGTTVGPDGPVRWAAVPVRFADDPRQAVLVAAALVQPERDALADTMRIYAVSSLLTLVVVGVVGWSVAGRLLRPLRDVRETAERIGESDLSQRISTQGSNEVTAMAATFNRMLDRLEAAFAQQRQFLDDAGHELRTPLTIVSGHMQVVEPSDPGDVEQTRRVVLDEVDRMGRLVGDLILLAKAERPDFVRPAPLRVADLVDGVLAAAQPLASRAWSIDEQADLVVHADRQRLTQALLALVTNAVRHTDDGDVVALGACEDGRGVRLWVRDSGPGIPSDERTAVFDRFHRASNARGDGTGLGLAIVAAIAHAHQGRAWAAEAASGGAMLCLWLPTVAEV